MARAEGPLLSHKAHKTFAGKLEFSHRNNKNFIRINQKPTDKRTTGQATERDNFVLATAAWQTLSANDKAEWDTFNRGS